MSTPAVTLSQDTDTTLSGINLRWVRTGLAQPKEVSLVYFKNSSDAAIMSADISPLLTRYNIPSGFVSGQPYSFQLQVVDVSDTMLFSNTLVLTAPWSMSPPVISSVSGGDQKLKVQLSSTTNIVNNSDTVIEFALVRDDNFPIRIQKPYAPNGLYTLSSVDDNSLTNNVSYRVSCNFQPVSGNARYKSPSSMSNTILGTPSNTPNAPQSVTSSSIGVATRDVVVNWTRPSDFSEWSGIGFSIVLQLVSSVGAVYTNIMINQNVTQYVWSNLDSGASYLASVQYVNDQGDGPVVESSSGSIYPTSQPDSPFLISASEGDQQSIVVWGAPTYFGQSPITAYKVYKNGSLYTTVDASTYSCTVMGLQNGYDYSFYVVAVNSIGSSDASSSLIANPCGQMYIVSCNATGKTITAVINPNGRPIQSAMFVGLDSTPNDLSDGSFFGQYSQQEISQMATQNITVVMNFNQFSTNIAYGFVIAHNSVNSASAKTF